MVKRVAPVLRCLLCVVLMAEHLTLREFSLSAILAPAPNVMRDLQFGVYVIDFESVS